MAFAICDSPFMAAMGGLAFDPLAAAFYYPTSPTVARRPSRVMMDRVGTVEYYQQRDAAAKSARSAARPKAHQQQGVKRWLGRLGCMFTGGWPGVAHGNKLARGSARAAYVDTRSTAAPLGPHAQRRRAPAPCASARPPQTCPAPPAAAAAARSTGGSGSATAPTAP